MMSETANPNLVHTEVLTAEAERAAALLDSLGAEDWTRQAPACPGWNVRKVARHIGTAHRWAAAIVRSPDQTPVSPRSLALGFPDSYAGYGDWIREGADDLSLAMRESGPDKLVWSWGPEPHARFWSRRMLHETAMHRADIELALGRTPEFDPAVAADGIDEFLTVLPSAAAFAPKVRALTGDGETLRLRATDGDPGAPAEDRTEWLITLEPNGFRWRRSHARGAAAVRGPVGELYLFTWGRRAPGAAQIEVLGDHTLLDHWVRNASF